MLSAIRNTTYGRLQRKRSLLTYQHPIVTLSHRKGCLFGRPFIGHFGSKEALFSHLHKCLLKSTLHSGRTFGSSFPCMLSGSETGIKATSVELGAEVEEMISSDSRLLFSDSFSITLFFSTKSMGRSSNLGAVGIQALRCCPM